MLDDEWEDTKLSKRVQTSKCLGQMSDVRDQIKQKLLTGRHEEIGDEWFMMRMQVFEHLDEATKQRLNLTLE